MPTSSPTPASSPDEHIAALGAAIASLGVTLQDAARASGEALAASQRMRECDGWPFKRPR